METIEVKRRIGLFGGTFDPPHFGHLLLAETALVQLELDEVRWLPVGDTTHKSRSDLSAAGHRVEMVRRLIDENEQFVLDLTDVERTAPHYTATLLPLIREQFPDANLWLLVGGDSLRDFHKWYEPELILAHCRLGVLQRPGAEIDWSTLEHIPELKAHVDLLQHDGVAISSTRLREWSRTGRSHQETTADILQYIEFNDLYEESRPS